MGSISGVRPMAMEMANSSACSQSCLFRPLMRNTSGTIISMKRISRRLTALMPRSKLVIFRRPESVLAMFPK